MNDDEQMPTKKDFNQDAVLEGKVNRGEPVTAQTLIDTFAMVPTVEPQRIPGGLWYYATSDEQKWELFDGMPFSPEPGERDRLTMCLIYSMGLRHLVALLPDASLQKLKRLLSGSL